jgi:small-conductance mechanosensitive channel
MGAVKTKNNALYRVAKGLISFLIAFSARLSFTPVSVKEWVDAG